MANANAVNSKPRMMKVPFLVRVSLAAVVVCSPLSAQFVRETPAPSVQPSQPKQSTPSAAPTQAPTGKRRISQEIQLTGDSAWTDTGIDVQAGEHVVITASGKLRYADAKADNTPDGLARGFKDLIRVLPFNDAGRGALIGRIGDADIAQPFLIGVKRDVLMPVSGRLSVGINQTTSDVGDGTYSVRIEVYAPEGGRARVVARQVSSLPGVNNDVFSKIPRRIGDKQGNPGDMVNFLIIGSEVAMQRVFTTAGWVKVDADVKDTVLHGLIESLSKESYLTMPMSQLYLFGRPQDYGWAHAEPISVVRSRNHLRIWKAPFDSVAKPCGLAPPHMTSALKKTNATMASRTRSIRISTLSEITWKKLSPPPGSSLMSLTFFQTTPSSKPRPPRVAHSLRTARCSSSSSTNPPLPGRTIGVMDAFFAATAEVHSLTLVTRNVLDFTASGVALFNPWN